jgi:hypothetical protein
VCCRCLVAGPPGDEHLVLQGAVLPAHQAPGSFAVDHLDQQTHTLCRYGDNFIRNSHDRDTAFNPKDAGDGTSMLVPNWDFPDRPNFAQQCGAIISGNFKLVRVTPVRQRPATTCCN